MSIKTMSHASLSIPIVISILSFTSSVAFMSGKFLAQVEYNTTNTSEIKQSLNEVNEENKKLWEYLLENADKNEIQSRIIENVLDR